MMVLAIAAAPCKVQGETAWSEWKSISRSPEDFAACQKRQHDEQEKGAKSYEQFKDNRKGTSQFPDFVVYAVVVPFGKFDDQLRADLVDVPGEGIGAKRVIELPKRDND